MNPELGDRERRSILEDLASADEEVRRLAVERLLTLPSAEAIPKLVKSLGDPGWRVRKAAVERLIDCAESDRVTEALIVALGDGDNPGRRNAAVEALVGCGSRVVPFLIEALDSDDVDVRKLMIDAIAGIGDESSRQPMLVMLDDADPNVRSAAADALGVLGGPEVSEALQQCAVRGGEDTLVRFSALSALARLETAVTAADLGPALDDPTLQPAALVLLADPLDARGLERLKKALASNSRAVREAAMTALLRRLADSDAGADRLADEIREAGRDPVLIEDAGVRVEEADLATRLVLVQFLGVVGAPECVVPILRAGRDEAVTELAHATLESMGDRAESALDAAWPDLDPDLRRDACGLLARTGGEAGEVRLESALDGSDSAQRSAAARALGRRRCGRVLPKLVRRLQAAAEEEDFEAEDELAAITEAIVALAGPEGTAGGGLAAQAIELLRAGLDGANEAVRISIATVLGRIGRGEDAKLVVFLLKDPSAGVRRAAVEALAHLEPGSASEPLRLALADESAAVRIAAATALGSSRNAAVLEDLPRLIGDEDPRVRAAAVRAIGAQCARSAGDSAATEAFALIERALEDCGEVALAAVEALAQVGGHAAARTACRLLDRAEPELVQAGVRCVGAHGDAGTAEVLLGLIAHPSWVVRADVVQTLAERHMVAAIPPILRRLETEQDDFVRDAILRALRSLEG